MYVTLKSEVKKGIIRRPNLSFICEDNQFEKKNEVRMV